RESLLGTSAHIPEAHARRIGAELYRPGCFNQPEVHGRRWRWRLCDHQCQMQTKRNDDERCMTNHSGAPGPCENVAAIVELIRTSKSDHSSVIAELGRRAEPRL